MFEREEREILLGLARNAIANYLETGTTISAPIEEFLSNPLPAFVTLKIDNELRGCIGSTEGSEPLGNTVIHCAISAAFRDPRFPPLTAEEFSLIQLEISVLSQFHRITKMEEVTPGIHGLMVTQARNRGLLLPQVAMEYEWDRYTFLDFTCRKAGLPPDAWKDPNTIIEIFTAEILKEE